LILVFGAGGQLAQDLFLVAASSGTPMAGLTHAEADIADAAAVARALDDIAPAVVINAAAYNAVDRAETEVAAAMRANAEGPGVLAAASARAGIPLIQVSTDYVFDGAKAGAYREDDPVNPLSAYAVSKARGEDAVRDALREHLIVRTAWLFGVHGSNFLKTMIRLAAERDHLDVVADQRGSPTSTADLARALLLAAAAIDAGKRPWGTYHFAGTGETTRHAFATRIVAAQAKFTGRAVPVNAVLSADYPAPAKRPRNSALDSTKFAQTFGFRAADWRDAVDQTVAALFRQEAHA
jgi:dTDP-4-dehydrorhamnose reductase